MAEKYYSVSPYFYCAGNPAMFIDPEGGNTDYGSPIYSTHEGIVTVHDNNTGKAGRYVVITSPDGKFRTRYLHLSATNVVNNQYVWETNKIGEMGGSASGKDDKWISHLHYEIQEYQNGIWESINPVGSNDNKMENIIDPQLNIDDEDKIYYGGELVPAIITD